jgi:hypothetical protein
MTDAGSPDSGVVDWPFAGDHERQVFGSRCPISSGNIVKSEEEFERVSIDEMTREPDQRQVNA